MHKKLLLLSMAFNCAIIQASESVSLEKNYEGYTVEKTAFYQSALINVLSGDEQAIADEDEKNKKENKEEEENNRKKQYDGVPGYWSSGPTLQSKSGRKFQKYAQNREKDGINKVLSNKANENKDKFNKEILPKFQRALEVDRFFINNYCLPALKDCREDVNCYDEKGLSSKILTNPEFGLQREAMLYACGAKFASECQVQLTAEELRMIAEHNPITHKLFDSMHKEIINLSVLRDEILNPKSQEESV